MATIARTAKAGGGTDFNSGQTIDPAEVNTDFNTAYTEINGNLDDGNIETATIPGAKSLRFTEISAPSTPSSNDVLVYGTDGTGTLSWLSMKDASARTCLIGRTFHPGISIGTAIPLMGTVCISGGVATGANTTETDTISYTLPANSLNTAGDALEFRWYVRTAANANNKRFRIYLGSTAVFDTTAVAWNGQSATIYCYVTRVTSASQTALVWYNRFTTNTEGNPTWKYNPTGTATEDLTTNLALRCTMLNGTASASDCLTDLVTVQWFGKA